MSAGQRSGARLRARRVATIVHEGRELLAQARGWQELDDAHVQVLAAEIVVPD